MSPETSTVGGDQSVEVLRRELAEAREQQAATAEILRVISSAPTDVQRVFAEIAESAARLCDAYDATIHKVDGDMLLVAHHGPIPAGDTFSLTRGFFIGRAVLDRRTIHIADLQAETDEFPEGGDRARRHGFRTILAVPLIRAGEAIGVIALRRIEVRPFTDRQAQLLKTFADQAVIAIENTRLFEEVREALQQQTATADVFKVISRSTFDIQTVLDTLVDSAARLCYAESAQIFRRSDINYHLTACCGYFREYEEYERRISLSPGRDSLIGRIALEGRLVHIPDVLADAEYNQPEAQRLGHWRTMLGVPLLRDGTPIGAMSVTRSTVRPFTDKQIELLTSFADHAVIAIENTRLFEEVQARTKELQESLEYQTAIGDVLGVISRSPSNVQPVLDMIAETAMRLCQSDRASIWRLEVRGHRFVAMAPANEILKQRLSETIIPVDRASVSGRVAIDGCTVHVHDAWEDSVNLAVPELVRDIRRTILGVPLLSKGAVAGVIILPRSRVEPFTKRQIALVETFAEQAVIAIENARLFEAEQISKRELQESLQQQAATADVFKVISRSTFDLQAVLDTLVEDGPNSPPKRRRLLCRGEIRLLARIH